MIVHRNNRNVVGLQFMNDEMLLVFILMGFLYCFLKKKKNDSGAMQLVKFDWRLLSHRSLLQLGKIVAAHLI